MTDKKVKKLKRKLQESRFRLISRAPVLARPLIDMLYVAVKGVRRMSTNGNCIYFDAAWLEKLNDYSLDYALCHQLMHIKLGHLGRPRIFCGDRFHYACNVIVNSNLAVYGFVEDVLTGIGELHYQTSYPHCPGNTVTPLEAFKMTPFDPSEFKENRRTVVMFDSDFWWDKADDRGQSGTIVLSPNDPEPDDLLPAEMLTGERRYRDDWKKEINFLNYVEADPDSEEDSEFNIEYETRDISKTNELIESLQYIKSRDASKGTDDSLRVIREVRFIPQDWRTLLNHFIMDETRDYDFTPPDKRFQDLDFFLPDFNEETIPRLNVLFMIDMSASIDEQGLFMAIGELRSAMEQFDGMLRGTVGFFDTIVRRVMPITTFSEISNNVPIAGGGTDFGCVFDYIKHLSPDELPSEIVIMTDGRADFPDYSVTLGIPVLWLVTSKNVRIPWGQAAYFKKW